MSRGAPRAEGVCFSYQPKDLISIDFFVVPTAMFRILYVFLVLEHDRRRIVHFSVTEGPSARWTGQQLVNAFPYDSAPKYLEYYHGFRTHLALGKDAPEPRECESTDGGNVIALPMVGGLHHRYTRRAAGARVSVLRGAKADAAFDSRMSSRRRT